jgi:hypothetical protein
MTQKHLEKKFPNRNIYMFLVRGSNTIG